MSRILFLLVLNLFLYVPSSFALDDDNEEELSRKQRVVRWFHTRHSPKHVGLDDPHLPASVGYRRLNFPSSLSKDQIPNDLRKLGPQYINSLGVDKQRELIRALAHVQAELRWSDKDGAIHKSKRHHWQKSNAAAILAIDLLLHDEVDLFSRIVAIAPDAVIPSLRGHMAGLLEPDVLAAAIWQLLSELAYDEHDESFIPGYIGVLVQQSLEYWANKDIKKIVDHVDSLLANMLVMQKKELTNKEEICGTFAGSILAGAMKHGERIKEIDEKRIFVVNVASNIMWAATSFIGVIPMAAPAIAGAAGGLSLAAVLTTTVMPALNFPRNFSPVIHVAKGRLQAKLLKSAAKQNSDVKIDTLALVKWMDIALDLNGVTN